MAFHLICDEKYFEVFVRERLETLTGRNAAPVFSILRLTAVLGLSIGYPPLIIHDSQVLPGVD